MPRRKKELVKPESAEAGDRGGFYGDEFTRVEARDLGAAVSTGLQDEIALLRVAMRRLFTYANLSEETDPQAWAKVLNSLSGASARLSTLLRTQRELGGSEKDEIMAALNQALKEVNEGLSFP